MIISSRKLVRHGLSSDGRDTALWMKPPGRHWYRPTIGVCRSCVLPSKKKEVTNGTGLRIYSVNASHILHQPLHLPRNIQTQRLIEKVSKQVAFYSVWQSYTVTKWISVKYTKYKAQSINCAIWTDEKKMKIRKELLWGSKPRTNRVSAPERL